MVDPVDIAATIAELKNTVNLMKDVYRDMRPGRGRDNFAKKIADAELEIQQLESGIAIAQEEKGVTKTP